MKSFEFPSQTGFLAVIFFFCELRTSFTTHQTGIALHGELQYAWSLEVTIKENSKSDFSVEKNHITLVTHFVSYLDFRRNVLSIRNDCR